MKPLSKLIGIVCIVILPVDAQKNIKLTSPNGNIGFSFELRGKKMMYTVTLKGKTIVDYSSLSLQFDNGNFETNLKFNKPVFRDTTEEYELVVGKTKRVHSHYKEVTIPRALQSKSN
ncbi:MAG: glycoside hydrolase family 97 N-terminal domain-containing protein [Ginsengibacter sp.]